MPQVFPEITNLLARASIVGLVFGLPALALVSWGVYRSPWVTRAEMPLEQPVPFSHKHHVSDDGIDCRFCHTSVETSSFAGIPPTQTCMTCHSIVWNRAAVLEPVRTSYAGGAPLRWVRVHDLPEFVFFDHGIHVAKGVGCSTCHGRIDGMPLTRQVHSLQMRWCLDCHEDPAKNLRPQSAIFAMDWTPPPDQATRGAALVRDYGIDRSRMLDCATCHR
jgi:hypothetical protein